MRISLPLRLVLVVLAATASSPERAQAQAANVLVITSVVLDPPTLHMLGVQMLIGGDQNRNAQVAVRYRTAGSTEWRDGPPLFRVLPETVTQPVPEQLAGTIFDLAPDSTPEASSWAPAALRRTRS